LSRKDVTAPKITGRGSAKKANSRVPALLLAGVGALVVLALLTSGNTGSATPNPSAKPLIENGGLWQSAVQIAWATKDADGELSDCGGGGSGGLVGEIDQVLTNEHVINDSDNEGDCADATLYVGYPVEPTGVYFVWWPATVRGSNEFLDLALLDVEMNAAAVADDSKYPASIVLQHHWPVYALATEVPLLGDPVSIYSYPGIGGYSMTFTAGHVAGWSWDFWSEEDAKDYSTKWIADYNADSDGYRDYMKLDATIAHGSSGSSVLNADGEIIGVSSLLGVNYQDDTVDCSIVVDFNEDGSYDDKDMCVPAGGFLNASATLTDIRAFLTKQGVDLTP
jgi:serine protease Do